MLLDFKELPPLTNEEVRHVFMNTLDLITGFGILFVQCSPVEADQLIPRVRRELPDQKIGVLELEEPIHNLYELVENRRDQENTNILFVRGLEKSLVDDVKPGYRGLGGYYNLNTVPPILSHLNQQRENFRDNFGNICFVFILPIFAIRYFVRRAPDFYDWNSGVFKIEDLSSKSLMFLSQPLIDQGNYLASLDRYEEAIALYDQAATIKPDSHEVWFNRGHSFFLLGRYDEAYNSYHYADRNWRRGINMAPSHQTVIQYKLGTSISVNPNLDKVLFWYNRGVALKELGRYEEATKSLHRAVAAKIYSYGFLKHKSLIQFFANDYQSALFIITWVNVFKKISAQSISRYYDFSRLIQEFIEELIPRFTQPSIQQTIFIPFLKIYQQANVITELGTALINTLHLIVAPTISDHTAAEWLSLWRTSSLGNEPAMELPLRLMSTAIEYKKDPSKRDQIWLNLPSEERSIIDKALKLSE